MTTEPIDDLHEEAVEPSGTPIQPWFVVKRFADIWSWTPWVARIFMGIMQLKDQTMMDDELKKKFEDVHQPILVNLLAAFKALNDIRDLINAHGIKLEAGSIYTVQNGNVSLNETIDHELNTKYKDFIISLHTAVKDVQSPGKILGLDFWFFYQDDKKFEIWKKAFLEANPNMTTFIQILEDDRQWYNELNIIRYNYIHGGYVLPDITYDFSDRTFSISEWIWDIQAFWHNGWNFIEDMMIASLQLHVHPMTQIYQIPEGDRNPEAPLRYMIGVKESFFPPEETPSGTTSA